ncbi:MAG: hypothetical protein GPJ52_02930 [Candidatus Heimdallarchaeota archaeon]|nr:hypothetical protein [Candidatus Heimdallarchaeota archaeon]
MIRSKAPKDEKISEENLIGKSIVDPNGHIIGKCICIFEDDKKKLRMKIAIKTELNSDFIVEETIPTQLIKNIGEVILLKREFEIQPIALEDIVTFEVPDEKVDIPQIKKSEVKTKAIPVKKEAIAKKQEVKKKVKKETTTKSKKITQSQNEQFNELFHPILEEKDSKIRNVRIVELVKKIIAKKSFAEIAIPLLMDYMADVDLNIRTKAATIFNHISERSPQVLLHYLPEGLESVYNEPSKDIEQLIINYLTRTATDVNSKILLTNISSFFFKLIIKRTFLKNITRSRIHNLNLKIFVNNFYVQEMLINNFLKRIIEKKEDAQEFAQYLKDYNAIIIAFTLIKEYSKSDWKIFLESPYLERNFEKPFIESIENIIEQFNNGNINDLADILDSKLGYHFSYQLIQKMIKLQIDDVLANVSIIPIEILSSLFKDDKDRVMQIILDLLYRQEISAQITIIDGKTFISPRDL